METTNIAVTASSVLLLAVYHAWLISIVRHAPHKTVYGLSAHSRKAWVCAIMKGNKDILAVQSLRNLIMASSILASTCVAIIFGFIAFLATVVSHPESVDVNGNPLGSQFGFALDSLFGPKVMVLLLVFCIAFFCFAQSMRFYNHVGMVININLSEEEMEECFHLSPAVTDAHLDDCGDVDDGHHSDDQTDLESVRCDESLSTKRRSARSQETIRLQQRRDSPAKRRERHAKVHARASQIDFVARMLNRGAMFYTLGMRGYYISFPIMAFLWGPWALLGTTILLVGILRIVDFNLETLSPAGSSAERETKEATTKHSLIISPRSPADQRSSGPTRDKQWIVADV
ncbi:UNVERIFIED_CONTAM: hypothetical protein HDU68_002947 [Siphonaria sp. JEL0065]|nr:hypothetical protein HDU68_002947 [Siphonaria sp. JEL0065]